MKRLPFIAALVSLATVLGTAQTRLPGMPPRDNAGTTTGTGRLSGRVVSADTSTPLRRAQVSIRATEGAVSRVATTNADGRYEFTQLPAGRYSLNATKSGYVSLQYGQRRPLEPGRPIALANDQTIAQIDFALPRGAVVAGRITDEFGEPLAMAAVSAQRYQYGPGGQRRLTFGGPPATTDDLGQFRIFGLMPGEYVISATVRAPMMLGPGAPTYDSTDGYPPTYYPGTSQAANAQPIIVGVGEERTIFFTLLPSRMTRITGTVVDSQGRPVAAGMITIRSGSSMGGMVMMGGQTAADGTFTIANVAPGEHSLDVRPSPRGQNGQTEFASVPITATGDDITGLHIATSGGALVKGHVVFEGSSPRTGGPMVPRVMAQATDPQAMPAILGDPNTNGVVADDGSFELRTAPGNVLFRVGPPPSWALKSVRINGADVTDQPYDLKGTDTLEDVTIVLTDRVTDVSGTVANSRAETLKDYVVVLLRTDVKDATVALRYTRSVRPDQSGNFRVRGLPPGEYVAAAVDALEQGREWDPEFQCRIHDDGKAFRLGEGQMLSLNLKLTSD